LERTQAEYTTNAASAGSMDIDNHSAHASDDVLPNIVEVGPAPWQGQRMRFRRVIAPTDL